MKQNSKRILIGMCAILMAVSMAACGNSGKQNPSSSAGNDSSVSETSKSESSAASTPESSSEPSSASSAVTGKFESLDAFLKSDIMQQQLKVQQDALKDSGMSIDIMAEGNKLIYHFTIESEEMVAAMDIDALKAGVDAQASTYEAVAKSLTAAVDMDSPVVVVRYLDNAGKELYSQEFAAG